MSQLSSTSINAQSKGSPSPQALPPSATHKKIKDGEVKIKIDGSTIKTLKHISVNENSVLFKNAETLKIGIPKSIGSGYHDLVFSFIVNKKTVSSNQFKILVKKYEDL